jgi:acyl phosphate:glycerol-3-phosphate acyltransferase
VPVLMTIISYLIGSIPFAYIMGRVTRGIDIRKVGDGNVGAANAYREISPAAGLFVMVADVMKGVTVILAAQGLHLSQTAVFIAGLACVIGHIYPLYLGFKGGRGEAAAAGVLVVLLPVPILSLFAISLIPLILTRNTMLLGTILFAPLWLGAILTGASLGLIIYSIVLPIVVGVQHLITTRKLATEVRRRSTLLR